MKTVFKIAGLIAFFTLDIIKDVVFWKKLIHLPIPWNIISIIFYIILEFIMFMFFIIIFLPSESDPKEVFDQNSINNDK